MLIRFHETFLVAQELWRSRFLSSFFWRHICSPLWFSFASFPDWTWWESWRDHTFRVLFFFSLICYTSVIEVMSSYAFWTFDSILNRGLYFFLWLCFSWESLTYHRFKVLQMILAEQCFELLGVFIKWRQKFFSICYLRRPFKLMVYISWRFGMFMTLWPDYFFLL